MMRGSRIHPSLTGGIMLLSHADTDLLTLTKTRELLPAELKVNAYSLNALRSEEQMEVLLAGELGSARVIVLRVHGPLSCVPGFDRLRAMCLERGQSLVLVSGTGELTPEFSQTVNVPGDVMETATSYLTLGGIHNFAELFRFLSDRLLLTGYGYAPPSAMPEHGIYLPDMDNADDRRLGPAGRPAQAYGSCPLLPGTSHERQHRLHRHAGASVRGERTECALHLYLQSQSQRKVAGRRHSSGSKVVPMC